MARRRGQSLVVKSVGLIASCSSRDQRSETTHLTSPHLTSPRLGRDEASKHYPRQRAALLRHQQRAPFACACLHINCPAHVQHCSLRRGSMHMRTEIKSMASAECLNEGAAIPHLNKRIRAAMPTTSTRNQGPCTLTRIAQPSKNV